MMALAFTGSVIESFVVISHLMGYPQGSYSALEGAVLASA